jgi:hypothetical protein
MESVRYNWGKEVQDEEAYLCETESGRFGECASLLSKRRIGEVRLLLIGFTFFYHVGSLHGGTMYASMLTKRATRQQYPKRLNLPVALTSGQTC